MNAERDYEQPPRIRPVRIVHVRERPADPSGDRDGIANQCTSTAAILQLEAVLLLHASTGSLLYFP